MFGSNQTIEPRLKSVMDRNICVQSQSIDIPYFGPLVQSSLVQVHTPSYGVGY